MVQEFQDKSAMQEFSHTFTSNAPFPPISDSCCNQKQFSKNSKDGGDATTSDGVEDSNNSRARRASQALLMESKLQEFEIEMERLCSRMEHLKAQNEVLTLSLEESKANCENMAVLMGKYESNLTAYGLVMSYSDQIIESLELLGQILEDQLSIALINADKSRLSNIQDRCQSSGDSVKSLIIKLEAVVRPDSGLAMPSTSSNDSSNHGGWEDSSGYSQNTR